MRRKKRARRTAKVIQRGSMWMVDLSSQYWMALLTESFSSSLVGLEFIFPSVGYAL